MLSLSGIITILEKFYHRYFLKKNQSKICFNKYGKIADGARLVFYLNYPKFIHFGDSLWFEPIIRLLKTKYEIVIYCHPELEFYFKHLGYQIINQDQILVTDVLVTRTELAYCLRGFTNNIFFINFSFDNLNKPLIVHVLLEVIKYLNLAVVDIAYVNDMSKPQIIKFAQFEIDQFIKHINLDIAKDYVIYNDYMDSHKWSMSNRVYLSTRQRLRRFLLDALQSKIFCKHQINESLNYDRDKSLAVIYTGTMKDKQNDSMVNVSLVNEQLNILDLRGKTSIREAFMLASLSNIKSYVGFDTLWVHLFNLYDKDCNIMLKPGFNDEYNKCVKKYVVVPYFESLNNLYGPLVKLYRIVFI